MVGDRKYAPDNRLFISFRDTTLESPTKGDWVVMHNRADIKKGARTPSSACFERY